MIFNKLPVEIYLIIFDYLELSDFINFSKVCKSSQNIIYSISNHYALKYKKINSNYWKEYNSSTNKEENYRNFIKQYFNSIKKAIISRFDQNNYLYKIVNEYDDYKFQVFNKVFNKCFHKLYNPESDTFLVSYDYNTFYYFYNYMTNFNSVQINKFLKMIEHSSITDNSAISHFFECITKEELEKKSYQNFLLALKFNISKSGNYISYLRRIFSRTPLKYQKNILYYLENIYDGNENKVFYILDLYDTAPNRFNKTLRLITLVDSKENNISSHQYAYLRDAAKKIKYRRLFKEYCSSFRYKVFDNCREILNYNNFLSRYQEFKRYTNH